MAYSIKLIIDTIEYDVSNYVITDSLKVSYSLFNNLEPTTNKLDFRLLGNAPVIPYLLTTNDKVTVEVKKDSTYLFKGYLTDNFAWQITNRGKQPIAISAEDPGIKLLKRNWVSSNGLYTTFSDRRLSKPTDRANSVVHIICTLAGVTVSANIPAVDLRITANILDSDNATYWDVLKQMTYELGYVFYFDESGELSLYKIAKDVINTTHAFSTDTNIIAESDNKGIDVKKQLRTYKQIDVSWQEWETKTDFYVFRDTTNGTNQYDCVIELAAGAYYPSGADANNFVFQEYKTEDGKVIVNVNSATLEYIADAGITAEFENLGRKGKIRFHNVSAATSYIRKLKVKATNAIVEKNTNTTKAGDNTTPILKYTAKYVHDATNASYLANTLKDYYLYSNYSYTFKSKDEVAVGSIVSIQDNTWNTVNENVLITEKERNNKEVFSYTAIGIDQFNLLSAVGRDVIQTTSPNLQPISITSLADPTITIGTTTINLGGTTSSLSGVSVTASEFNYDKQRVYPHLIPGSNYQILTQQNKGTELSDVFTIYELLAPYTALTETTYSMHNVVNGWDDWVRDVSFHNYGSKMKSVDVISHFTGTTAGDWQWVSRYTTGTDYDMVERYLMTIEGDTGNVKIGEDGSVSTDARGKLDVRAKGAITKPSVIISLDSNEATQPSALHVENGYNYAYSGNLTTLKVLNSGDSATVLKLENAGTGHYINADSKFILKKSGEIEQSGNVGINNAFVSGALGTGWKLDYNSSVTGKSYLEIDNLMVRDTLRTHIFQKDVVRATNGQLYVSDCGVIAEDYIDGTNTLYFDADKSATFDVGTRLYIKDIIMAETQIIPNIKFDIAAIGDLTNGKQAYTITWVSGDQFAYSGSPMLRKGMTAVRISGGNLLLDASSTYSPYLDVINNNVVKTRLGRLDGISGCEGYGLYSDNVYLNGKITAIAGAIGSFNISTYLNTGSKTTYNDGVTGVHLGSDGLGIGSSFTVSNAGLLTAIDANISGTVNASSGSFSGTINADNGFFGGSIESGPLILNKNPPATTSMTISGGVISFLQSLTSNTGLASGTFACTGSYNSINIGSITFNLSSSSTEYYYTYRWHYGPVYFPDTHYVYITQVYKRVETTYSGNISLYRLDNEQLLYSASDTYRPASNWENISTDSFDSANFNSGWDTAAPPDNVPASGGSVNFSSSGSVSFTAGAYTYKLVNLPAGYSASYANGTVYYDSNGFLKIKI